MSATDGPVLVTGGTGFLGGWCIAELLERGHTVRTTVRSAAREDAVRAAVSAAGAEADGRLSVHVADLTSDDGWADAVGDCRYVLHVASPFPPVQPQNPDDLIVPARDGALRVLRASLEAGVERIVLTSSVAAIRGGRTATAEAPLSEKDWTDPADTKRTPYVRSKAAAERAAWDHVREAGAEDRLAAINPGAIIGPVLSDDRSFSLQAIERLFSGTPAVPRLGFSFVDVRDVADLHIRAMSSEAAGGERFIAADRWLWMADIARILRDRLGPEAANVPTRVAPDLLIRGMALFDKSARSIVGDLGKTAILTNEKARTKLGWQPRPIEDSIEDTARSLIERGVLKSAG